MASGGQTLGTEASRSRCLLVSQALSTVGREGFILKFNKEQRKWPGLGGRTRIPALSLFCGPSVWGLGQLLMPWVTSQQPESFWSRPPVAGLLVTSPGPLPSLKGPVGRPTHQGILVLQVSENSPYRSFVTPSSVWEPCLGAPRGDGQTPANENRKVWEAREVLIRQIGLRITHSKQSKLYLLPWEPELLTAKRDLW